LENEFPCAVGLKIDWKMNSLVREIKAQLLERY
jgi:hypothetical protein